MDLEVNWTVVTQPGPDEIIVKRPWLWVLGSLVLLGIVWGVAIAVQAVGT